MGAAGPMNQQNDLGGNIIKICHHFLNHRADDALLKPGIGGRRKPDAFETGSQDDKVFRRQWCSVRAGRVVLRKLLLDLLNPLKRPVPPGFQLRGHEAVLRVGRVILPEGPVSCVLSRLQVTAKRIADLVPLAHGLPGGRLCGGDGTGTDHLQERMFNGIIDPQAAEGNAARFAVVQEAAP